MIKAQNISVYSYPPHLPFSATPQHHPPPSTRPPTAVKVMQERRDELASLSFSPFFSAVRDPFSASCRDPFR
ncbi:hypothetical protein E2C01_063248 [Portunus trituberculatus]|uniref:Uncharacterized protein n=1 Tax=Portunus trituberculatus TaxID=210409 RepID=A0A5B7HHM0_PORTR|nr:hypothetical protein [Portunus trituberculatus]